MKNQNQEVIQLITIKKNPDLKEVNSEEGSYKVLSDIIRYYQRRWDTGGIPPNLVHHPPLYISSPTLTSQREFKIYFTNISF